MRCVVAIKLFVAVCLVTAIGCTKAAMADAGTDAQAAEQEQPPQIDRTVPPNPVERVNADGLVVSHAMSIHSEAKYPADFEHTDYVNPDAPKGGDIVRGEMGTFDNFNRYALRGDAAPNSEELYDSLMVASLDEIDVYYGLIAQSVAYPPSYEWIIFHLRPQARFQDGKKITAQDVVFSFNKFFNEGVPQFREYYKSVTSVEALDDEAVKFTLEKGRKDLLISLGQLKILPPQYWRDRKFSEPLSEPPLGSGAYAISDYSMGQFVTYSRVKDYWANDVPIVKGTNNFDSIRFDLYRDETVQLEALKAGEIDFRQESVAKQWATSYKGANFDAGYIIAEEINNQVPPSYTAFVFNISRPIFSDERVREAIGYLFDFEWTNKNLFYGQYKRLRSFFQNTPFEALGTPSPEEVGILEPYRDKIPKRVFTTEYQPPVSDGSGLVRDQITKAKALLAEAGWEVRDQKMVNAASGEPLKFEMLIYSPTWERIIIPFKENLAKMGVEMEVRLVDTTQFQNRLRSGDYDMTNTVIATNYYPDSDLNFYWHSAYIDSTYNSVRVQDEVLDYLVEGIVAHQQDNQALVSWGRALDRVLQWRHYTIPTWYNNSYRVAYWNKFSRPKVLPKYSLGFNTWWYDEEKAATLPK